MTETNFTNEQLEAWAALKDVKFPGVPGKTIVSQLAAALLAERKAREVEVGELKRLQAERDSAILWIHRLANNPRKPSTWMETREAASNFLANLLQTGKDQPHD